MVPGRKNVRKGSFHTHFLLQVPRRGRMRTSAGMAFAVLLAAAAFEAATRCAAAPKDGHTPGGYTILMVSVVNRSQSRFTREALESVDSTKLDKAWPRLGRSSRDLCL